MIKQLRRKFMFILISVVTLIICAVFITIIVNAYYNSYNMSMLMMEEALRFKPMYNSSEGQLPSTENIPLPEMAPLRRSPVIVVTVTGNDLEIENSQFVFLEENELRSAVEYALSEKASSGIIHEYSLRYLKEEDGNRVAFIDISREMQMISNMVMSSIFIGGIAFLCFWGFSLLLARWAVKPVEQAWRRQKQFVADASHELKTPLTVILSNAEMLESDPAILDEKNKKRIGHIYAEATQMKHLTSRLLALAKSDENNSKWQFDIVNFSEVTKNNILTKESYFYDGNKFLNEEIENNLFVHGDSKDLQEVVSILLDNAYKYSLPNSVTNIKVTKYSRTKLLFTVTSQGNPISKEEKDKIFERFYRVEEARSDNESFGLGLAIARSIVSKHKGKIWVESENGNNIFCITLPLAKANIV